MSVSQSLSNPHVDSVVESSDIAEITTERTTVHSGFLTTESEKTAPGPQYQEIRDIFSRPTKIGSGVIQSSDTPYLNLLGGTYNPYTKYMADPIVQRKIQNYGAFRGTLRITFVVTCPSNAYGCYILQALCEGQQAVNTGLFYESDSATFDSPYTSTQDIHGIIDVSESNTITLDLPFVYPFDDAYTTSLATYAGDPWRLLLWAIAPIQNAVNANVISGSYTIYANFLDDFRMGLPCLQVKKKFEGDGMLAKAGNKISDLRESKAVSGMSKKLASGAAMIGATVPMLAPLAGPLAAGAATVASLADWFGFTKEAKPMEPQPVVQRWFSSVNTVDGFDSSEIAGLFNTNATSFDATVGGGKAQDDASFASLFQRWTMIDAFTWNTSATAGTVIRNFPVTPFMCANLLGAYYPGPAGYVGMPFKYWRGGMEYKIIVASSAYHRGMLQVVWDFNNNQSSTSDPTNVLHNHVLDAASTKQIEFSVAYNSPEACLQNTGLFTISYQTTANYKNTNGSLYFRVVNQLEAVGGTAPVTVIVLSRACPDMRFGVPINKCTLVSDNYATTTTYGPHVCWQFQGAVGDDEKGEESFALVGDGDNEESYPVGPVLFGEEFASVRPLMQRFSRIGMVNRSASVSTTFMSPHFYPRPSTYAGNVVDPNSPGTATNPYWTWFSHYASLFVGIRGSARYKFICAELGGSVIGLAASYAIEDADYQVAAAPFDQFGNTVTFMEAVGVNTACLTVTPLNSEVTVPNYMNQKFWPYRFTGENLLSTNYRRDMHVFQVGPTGATYPVFVYYAAGPDIAPIKFRRTPAVVAAFY